jgi:anti-anti-sigma regulatory factor
MTEQNARIVEVAGESGLRNAREIAALLTQALGSHSTIIVDTRTATSLDVTIVQLLVAARKSALAAGKSLRLWAPAAGALREVLTRTGFVSADGRPLTPEGTFWTDTGQN